MKKFVHLSHITFINSKAESACKRVQKIIWTDQEKDLRKEVTSYMKGDFYRKTILQIHCRKEENDSFAKKEEGNKDNEKIFADYLGYTELKILDYFREIRNITLHNSKNNQKLMKIFNTIDLDLLYEKYNLQLNIPEKLAFTDVLLLSKVWQKSIRSICHKCLSSSDIHEYLKQRYKGVSNKERQKNGIRQTLKQNYLQTEEEIDIIMADWVG